MIVIADATPLNYLILIRQADLLPQLFTNVLIPPAVLAELEHVEAPDPVRAWIQGPPSWLTMQTLNTPPDSSLDHLDPGEREAIALAEQMHADQARCFSVAPAGTADATVSGGVG
jgi:predicted nucleic acid-binding protein